MKLITVTGGVLSGLGKGIAAASIGHLLADSCTVVPVKLDGYLNADPGTMNPVEHGEVFVLDDGSEVDMDFGHYERFLGVTCTSESSITMGKVFAAVQEKERRGDYLGKTVQFVPHVTDLIKERVLAAGEGADVLLVEVGGTVGDIESELFIEALRQLADDLGEENSLFVHLTYVPKPGWIGEHKTKPSQQSTQQLLQRGIIPDVLIARSEEPIDASIKKKIARFCNCDTVVSGHDVDDVYAIPLNFYEQGLLTYVNERLGLSASYSGRWESLVAREAPGDVVRVGVAGKYTSLEDSYASITEALMHAGVACGVDVELVWVETTDLSDVSSALSAVDAVIVPGGFGGRGIEGKVEVIRYCREHGVPFLGICYGMQLAVVEFARHVCGLQAANTTEVVADTPHPVVDILPGQREVEQKGASMRLGAYEASLQEGSLVAELYGSLTVSERHRHRFEVNPAYHARLAEEGLVICGLMDGLAEFVELPGHKFFVGTQAHPELKSSLDAPAPLFVGLVDAARSSH